MNWLGIAIYLLMTAWLLLVTAGLIAEDILRSTPITWRPITGFILGLLALIGIGWGHLDDWDDHDGHD